MTRREPNVGGRGLSPQARLRALLSVERRDLVILLIYGVVAGLLFLVIPIVIQAIVNRVGFGLLLQPMLILAVVVFVALAFAGALQAVQSHVIELLQRRIFARVADDLAYRLPRVALAAFDRCFAPELVNRFFDVLTVQKSASLLLFDGMTMVVQSVIGLTLMALYHPALFGFNVALIVALSLIFLVLGSGATDTVIAESQAKYAVAAWLEEIARHPMSFRSSGGLAIARTRADELVGDYLSAREAHFRVVYRQILGALSLQALVSFLLLAIGGWLVTKQELSLGQLVAAEFIVSVVTGAFAKLGKQIEVYYDLLAALDKLGVLTDLPLDESSGGPPPPGAGPLALRLERVGYTHLGEQPGLTDVDLEIEAGSHIAITGVHGAGKSTLLELLYGVREPSRGVITVEGVALHELDGERWRQQVELVREIGIFAGSVLDNVRLGREQLDEDRVRAALAAVALESVVARLPDGLHTELATGGAPLSPGQARRLMLARAIVARPRLLLLDEALGHLDAASQAAILDALFADDAPWTLVAATYNPNVIDRCERAYVLRGGRLLALQPSADREDRG
jgi:putative ABC transport system ATP-binding protein